MRETTSVFFSVRSRENKGSEGLSSGGLRGEGIGERSGCSSFGRRKILTEERGS